MKEINNEEEEQEDDQQKSLVKQMKMISTAKTLTNNNWKNMNKNLVKHNKKIEMDKRNVKIIENVRSINIHLKPVAQMLRIKKIMMIHHTLIRDIIKLKASPRSIKRMLYRIREKIK